MSHGLFDYIGDGKPHGRFDSMLFTDIQMWLVEYKMESTTAKDSNRWRKFSEGMGQIKEYYLYMKQRIAEQGDSISNYLDDDSIHSAGPHGAAGDHTRVADPTTLEPLARPH